MNRLKLIFHISTFISFVLMGIFIIYFFYSRLYPFMVIEVINPNAIRLTKTTVKSGDQIGLIFNYCKYMQIRSKITKNLINNDVVYTLVGNRASRPIPIGCHRVILDHTIPKGLSGKAIIKIYSSYQINTFRFVNYEWQTQEFTITK